MTQSEALDILKTGANVFLTGEPGSGKTHTVNAYAAYLASCGIAPAITASTGIAATHIGGVTIHSWCGIGVRERLTPYDLDAISGNRKVMERVGNANVLIIDEVSMLSANTLAMADTVCREARRRDEPFGGLQVVLVGDFFQLPPVSRQDSDSRSFFNHFRDKVAVDQSGDPESGDIPTLDFESGVLASPPQLRRGLRSGGVFPNFAFTSPVWQKANLLVCYLSEQHRQEDKMFLEFLSAIRRGTVNERHKALLRARYTASAEKSVTQLYSHNANVDHVNAAELSKLPGQPNVFMMTGHGPDPLVIALKRGCLSPEALSLKLGARVMFTKNDMGGRFVNGTTGVITEFSRGGGMPVVKTDSGRTVIAEQAEWSMQDGGRVLARITQIPLRLAWAITVHKSQGMSLDRAHMDLSTVFEYGQGYVALSRVRTLNGLTLSSFNARALEVHPEIKNKDAHFRAASAAAREKFGALPQGKLAELHANFIRASGGKPGAGKTVRKQKEKTDTLSLTKILILQGLLLQDVAHERGMTLGSILRHLEQLKEKGTIVPKRDLSHLAPDPDRFAEIEKAFTMAYKKTKKLELSPVRELLGDSFSFDELRLARLFLGM